MSETLIKFGDKLDELRHHGKRLNLLHILQIAKKDGIKLELSDIRFLSEKFGKFAPFTLPKFVTDFIAAYVKDRSPKSILDIWSGIGMTLIPIIQQLKSENALGLIYGMDEYQIAQWLSQNISVKYVHGDPFCLIDEMDAQDRFDFVIGYPPFNMKPRTSLHLHHNDNLIDVYDEKDKLLILKGAMRLNEDGVGCFITSPNFMFKKHEALNVCNQLSQFGLFLDAVLTLPSGTFTSTSIPGLLLIIRRQKENQLFVGELTANPTSNQTLLNNLLKRKNAKIVQLGALVDAQSFRSLGHLIFEQEIKKQITKLGLSPISLSEISININSLKSKSGESFPDIPNSIYLPKILTKPVADSLAKLTIESEHYIQIVLDGNKAFAPYVSHFLNTSLGLKIRQNVSFTFVVPRITHKELQELQIYLPSLNDQIEIVRLNNIIVELSTQLVELERQLWSSHPNKVKKLEKTINQFSPQRDFSYLINPLPFPLASILRTYDSSVNPEKKLEHLLHFFEALSQFSATLMLSALSSDKTFYAKISNKWRQTNENDKISWFTRTDFGGWNLLCRQVASEIRRLFDDKNEREMCVKLFGNPSDEFLQMIINKKLFDMLDQVKPYRDSKAHGGIQGIQEAERKLNILTSILNEILQLLLEGYEHTLLLLPKSSKFRDGIFKYEVQSLMGPTTPFKDIVIETQIPMDEQRLYLLHDGKYNPIEILPFFQIEQSPETVKNACYFYNRIDEKGVRWVSYHFEDQSEFYSNDIQIRSTLAALHPQEDKKNKPNE